MRIVEARELTVQLEGAMANAVVSFADHTVSLVALVSDQRRNGAPVIGLGFNSIGRFAQGSILRERLFPRVLATDPESLLDPGRKGFSAAAVQAAALRNEKPGGHGDRAGAVGALELAVWDLNAKLADEPAYQTIATHFERAVNAASAPVYAAGGYYYPDDALGLVEELTRYRDLGFTGYKMKVGGLDIDQDLARVEQALTVAEQPGNLAVDANGRFDLATALAFGERIAPLGLRWFEEPGDPLDYALNAQLAAAYAGPIATGENLFSRIDTHNLLRYGGLRPQRDVLQMDPGLSYGVTEYARMLELLEQQGFDRTQCQPHGGHLINLHTVIGLGLGGCEAYPGVFQPFGGYAPDCLVADGRVHATDAPGFGLEQKPELQPHITAITGNC